MGAMPSRVTFWLSGAAGVLSALAGAWTFFGTGLLRGPAVMDGSARGTALVALVVAVPLLLASMLAVRRASHSTALHSAVVHGAVLHNAVITWLGALSYLVYNAVLLLFMTPFNDAFLVYVAMLSTTFWSVVALVRWLGAVPAPARLQRRSVTRSVAVYVWVVVALNAAAWLRQIVPGLGGGFPPEFLVGTGLTTSAIYVQDLAIWLPLAAVAAFWLWRRRPLGVPVVGAVLVLWVLESVSIAVDQWFGHRADPDSSVASAAAVVPFAIYALVGLIPLFLLLPERPIAE